MLATRDADGSVSVLVWNLIPAKESNAFANGNPEAAAAGASRSEGAELTLTLRLNGLQGRKQVQVSRVGGDLGSAVSAWKAIGSPKYPTPDQIKQLRAAAELPKPEILALSAGEASRFNLTLPPNGMALLEFAK